MVLSRSGYADERSQGVLKNIHALGCEVDLIKGDVSILADVQRVFNSATVPIAGIIQGAMVLRVRFGPIVAVNGLSLTISRIESSPP